MKRKSNNSSGNGGEPEDSGAREDEKNQERSRRDQEFSTQDAEKRADEARRRQQEHEKKGEQIQDYHRWLERIKGDVDSRGQRMKSYSWMKTGNWGNPDKGQKSGSTGATAPFTFNKPPKGTTPKKTANTGGGGKPQRGRIRQGRVGMRGRMFSAQSDRTVIVKAKFVRAGKNSRKSIMNHTAYLQDRERAEAEPEREFFDRYRRGIERDEVDRKMLSGRGSRAAIHTIILSPDENTIDLEDYTRKSIQALEDRLGYKVDWYGIIHRNTDHHHIHVVIAGQIPGAEKTLQEDGTRHQQRDPNMKWKSEEADVRDLLGDSYDERAEKDPREERFESYDRRYSDEREETDPAVKDLLDGPSRSWAEIKTDRTLDWYERRQAIMNEAKANGELFLDRADLKEMRDAGNDYITRHMSLDRELDHAIEREMSMDLSELGDEPARERDESEPSTARAEEESERDRDDDNFAKGI